MPITWDESLVPKQSVVKVEHINEIRGYVSDHEDHVNSPKGHDSLVINIDTPANPWVLTHNLNAYPDVITLSDTGERMYGEPAWPDANTVIITFDVARAGKAFVN